MSSGMMKLLRKIAWLGRKGHRSKRCWTFPKGHGMNFLPLWATLGGRVPCSDCIQHLFISVPTFPELVWGTLYFSIVSDLEIRINKSGCPLTDDSLQTKRILPGFQFIKPGVKGIPRSSPWPTRSRVTAESTALMFRIIKAQHEETRVDQRKKLTRADIENKSAVAALACHLDSP